MFPLNTVLFPGMRLPLHIFEERYKEMVADCLPGDRPFVVALIESGPEVGGPAQPRAIGTTALIRDLERLPEGRFNLTAVGQERIRILDVKTTRPYLMAAVEFSPASSAALPAAKHGAEKLWPWLRRYVKGLARVVETDIPLPESAPDPLTVAYLVPVFLNVPADERQSLLEIDEVTDLLERERYILRREVALLRAMHGSDIFGD
ncbi:MAG: LON peptidase substrate-binding domain-containing protein [Chloroflexi bacterium]|nr:LON peptidase substrate-binding domain-containing protein [Chloroflexota bacterium]